MAERRRDASAAAEAGADGRAAAPRGGRPTAAALPLGALDMPAAEVGRRFRDARRSGTPAWLWPEVRPAAWRAELLAIGDATATLLTSGDATARLAAGGAAEDDDALAALCVAAYTSGMGPLLGRWVEEGRLRTSGAAARLLQLHLRHARLRARRLEALRDDVLGRLAGAGVACTLLKGAHTAWSYFPEPGVRPASDIDLRVEPGAVAAAEDALSGAGYVPSRAQHRPYRRTWSPAGSAPAPRSLLLVHAEDPVAVDLHASLDRNFFGVRTIRFDALVARGGLERWPGAPATWRLRQPALLLLLACHASEGLHQLSLLRLVEIVRVITADTAAGTLSWDAFLETAEALRCARFCHPALELADRLAPGTVPTAIRRWLAAAATPALRRLMAQLQPATAQRIDRVSIGERFVWSSGPVEHARRAAHALWPAPAGRSLAALLDLYARRGWTLLRGAARR